MHTCRHEHTHLKLRNPKSGQTGKCLKSRLKSQIQVQSQNCQVLSRGQSPSLALKAPSQWTLGSMTNINLLVLSSHLYFYVPSFSALTHVLLLLLLKHQVKIIHLVKVIQFGTADSLLSNSVTTIQTSAYLNIQRPHINPFFLYLPQLASGHRVLSPCDWKLSAGPFSSNNRLWSDETGALLYLWHLGARPIFTSPPRTWTTLSNHSPRPAHILDQSLTFDPALTAVAFPNHREAPWTDFTRVTGVTCLALWGELRRLHGRLSASQLWRETLITGCPSGKKQGCSREN